MEHRVGFEPTWDKPADYKTAPIDLYGIGAYGRDGAN